MPLPICPRTTGKSSGVDRPEIGAGSAVRAAAADGESGGLRAAESVGSWQRLRPIHPVRRAIRISRRLRQFRCAVEASAAWSRRERWFTQFRGLRAVPRSNAGTATLAGISVKSAPATLARPAAVVQQPQFQRRNRRASSSETAPSWLRSSCLNRGRSRGGSSGRVRLPLRS